ncbi:MAG: hypothetical protein HFE64_03795 [Lachnospiraceae bacterium]|nr:hypothetical protein [Lachnospiraceae bacterium]
MKPITFYYGKKPSLRGRQILFACLQADTITQLHANWKQEVLSICPKDQVLQGAAAESPHFTCWLGMHLRPVLDTDTLQLMDYDLLFMSAIAGGYERRARYFFMLVLYSLAEYWNLQLYAKNGIFLQGKLCQTARHCWTAGCSERERPGESSLCQRALERVLGMSQRGGFHRGPDIRQSSCFRPDCCDWQMLYQWGARLPQEEPWIRQVERIGQKQKCESARSIAWICILVMFFREEGIAEWVREGKKKAVFEIQKPGIRWRFEVERVIDGEKKACYSNKRLAERKRRDDCKKNERFGAEWVNDSGDV